MKRVIEGWVNKDQDIKRSLIRDTEFYIEFCPITFQKEGHDDKKIRITIETIEEVER